MLYFAADVIINDAGTASGNVRILSIGLSVSKSQLYASLLMFAEQAVDLDVPTAAAALASGGDSQRDWALADLTCMYICSSLKSNIRVYFDLTSFETLPLQKALMAAFDMKQ